MTADRASPYVRLYVHLGVHSHPWAPHRGRWLRPPYAVLHCRAGCQHDAYGPYDVARLVAHHVDLEHVNERADP